MCQLYFSFFFLKRVIWTDLEFTSGSCVENRMVGEGRGDSGGADITWKIIVARIRVAVMEIAKSKQILDMYFECRASGFANELES